MKKNSKKRKVRLDPLFYFAELPIVFLLEPDTKEHLNEVRTTNDEKFIENAIKSLENDRLSKTLKNIHFRTSSLKGQSLTETIKHKAANIHCNQLSKINDLNKRYEENSKKYKELISGKIW